MSYQFYDPAPVFFDILGERSLAGGSLVFYDIGTEIPKTTYSDAALTVPNANPVQLDSAGRSNTQIWLDGGYTVACRNAAGEQVFVRDVTSGDAAGATIPALDAGKFLTNDGSTLQWQEVRQVPDPAGFSNGILRTDGTETYWAASAGDEATQQSVTAAASTSINYANGPVIQLNQAVNIGALSFVNLPAAGRAVVLNIVRVKDNSETARTITWPASVRWPGGVAPQLTQSANAVDAFSLLTYDSGATFYGSAAMNLS